MACNQRMSEDYAYPVCELLTEPSEAAQDDDKRTRERALIVAGAGASWRRGLDFGCGIGANFALFAGVEGRRVIGVEPDAARAAAAAREGARLSGAAEFEIQCGDAALIEAWPADTQFDYILCCQVVGHTPVAECTRILAALRARLTPAGRLQVLYPVVFEAASATVDMPAQGDFFHAVDFTRAPDEAGFRQTLTRDAFDAQARAPHAGLLPVRCFRAPDIAWRRGADLPAAAEAPASMAKDLAGLELRSQLYSAHLIDPSSGAVMIGDMSTSAVRSR